MKEIDDLDAYANDSDRPPMMRFLIETIVKVLRNLLQRVAALEADYDRRQGE